MLLIRKDSRFHNQNRKKPSMALFWKKKIYDMTLFDIYIYMHEPKDSNNFTPAFQLERTNYQAGDT